MSPSFEQHVTSLYEPFFDKLVAALCCFARFSTTRQEYSTFLVLYRHEVSRYLDINNIAAIAMRPEIVHEQVVRVVNEEVQSVEHLFVVADERHFQVLVDHLLQLRLGLVFLVDQLDLTLLLGLLQQEVSVTNDLV